MVGQLTEYCTDKDSGINALIKIDGFKPIKGFDSKSYKEYFPIELFGAPIVEAIFSGHNNQKQEMPPASHAGYFKEFTKSSYGESADTVALRKQMKAHLAKKGDNLVDLVCVLKKQNDEQDDDKVEFTLKKVKLTRNGDVIMFSVMKQDDGELKLGSAVHVLPYENEHTA